MNTFFLIVLLVIVIVIIVGFIAWYLRASRDWTILYEGVLELTAVHWVSSNISQASCFANQQEITVYTFIKFSDGKEFSLYGSVNDHKHFIAKKVRLSQNGIGEHKIEEI